MQYPESLYSDEFPNGINFYILARAGASGAEEISNSNFDESAKQIANNQNRAGADNYNQIAKESGRVAGAALGFTAITSIAGEGQKGLAKAAAATAAAVGVGMIADGLAVGAGGATKLAGAISLFVPQSIITAYSANWDEVDLGPIAGKVATTGGSLKDLLESGGETAELVGRGAIAAAANIPAAIGLGDINMGDVFEATSKKVGNPYKEQLFKSMGFRQFSFTYTFSPKNEGEAKAVKDIIKEFKKNMHPDPSPDGMFLIYPSEFIIEFATSQGANPNLPKIGNCALKNVKVTYGPDGMYNTFKGSGGMPSETTMELQFVELETLTRQKVEDGF